MKKKVLAAIMTGAMLLSLAACGAKEQAPAETPEQGKTAEDTNLLMQRMLREGKQSRLEF